MPGSRASIPTLSTRMRTWTYQRKENEKLCSALSLHPSSLSPPAEMAMHPAGGSAKRERLRRATKEGGAAGPESRAANKQRAWHCAGLGKKRN